MYRKLLNLEYLEEDVVINLSPEHQSHIGSARSTGLKVKVKSIPHRAGEINQCRINRLGEQRARTARLACGIK